MRRRDVLAAIGVAAVGGAALGQALPGLRAMEAHAGPETLRFLAGVSGWGLPAAGPAGSKLLAVDFFDYHCPYCRAMEPVLDSWLRDNPDLRLIFAEYPILAPDSVIATRLALAAARQGRYLAAHRWLMRWRGRYTAAMAAPLAAAIGADGARLARDMADPAFGALLDRVKFAAARLEIQGTPALVSAAGIAEGFLPPAALATLVRGLRDGIGTRPA